VRPNAQQRQVRFRFKPRGPVKVPVVVPRTQRHNVAVALRAVAFEPHVAATAGALRAAQRRTALQGVCTTATRQKFFNGAQPYDTA
jgi:hypothetical protein